MFAQYNPPFLSLVLGILLLLLLVVAMDLWLLLLLPLSSSSRHSAHRDNNALGGVERVSAVMQHQRIALFTCHKNVLLRVKGAETCSDSANTILDGEKSFDSTCDTAVMKI